MVNFFYIDEDPEQCAREHGNKHLHKMVVECAQLGSACWHNLLDMYTHQMWHDEVRQHIYKATHRRHPVTLWLMRSPQHYRAVVRLGLALLKERQRRMEANPELCKKWKRGAHATTPVLEFLHHNEPPHEWFEQDAWIDPPKCMPEFLHYRENDGLERSALEAYRMYYVAIKVGVVGLKWEPLTERPVWAAQCEQELSVSPKLRQGVKRYREELEQTKEKDKQRRTLKRQREQVL